MHPHQVKTKAIDVILLYPMYQTLQHKLPHHRLFTCCFISTRRGIRKITVFFMTEIITWYQLIKIRTACICYMIVHHIHYHPQTIFMKCCHQLFQFIDPCCAIIWISTVRTFGYIVVQRIISPVVLFFFRL